MTAWGVVAVCGVGGGAAGPLLDSFARKVRRPPTAAPSVASEGDPADPGGIGGPELAGPHPAAVVASPPPAIAFPPGTPETPGTSDGAVPASRPAAVLEGAAAAVVTAAACGLAALRLGSTPQLAAYCVLAGALVVVSITDLRTGLVPRRIVHGAGAACGVALLSASAVDGSWRPMLGALLGAAVAFAVFAGVWWFAPKAMGFGDVRLAGLCGGALGWLGFAPVYLGFLAAFVAGAVMGLAVLAARGRRRFPFAPALALGTMVGVLWGTWLGNLWLHGG